MKRFILHIILTVLPICLIITLFNLIVDPAHLYGNGGYEEQVAKLLISSKQNVINVDRNCSARIFKKKLCEYYPDSVEVLVLGSSRMNLITSKYFQGKKLLNLWVSGGVIEDECALMYDCVKSGLKPDLVLLGVDPFYFNANAKEERVIELREQYDGYLKALKQNSPNMFGLNWTKWANLLSLSYFQQGIEKLKVEIDEVPVVSDNYENEQDTWHYDGTKTYRKEMRECSIETINALATNFMYHQWKDFDDISMEKVEQLMELIGYIRSLNIDVQVFMAPYHPITWSRFMRQPEFSQVKNIPLLIEKMLKDEGVKVIGNWNPTICRCDETDFYDAMHPKEKAIDKIFGEIY